MAKINGIDKIKAKILGDADTKVKGIRDQSRKEVARIDAKNKETRDEYESRYEERTAALVESYKRKSLAQARLDAKKSSLQERERVIDETVARVLASFDRKGAAYERFLKRVIDENKSRLDTRLTITCNKLDVKLIEKFAKEAKILTAEMAGGLILEDGAGRRVDESLEAVLVQKRDEIRQAAVAALRE